MKNVLVYYRGFSAILGGSEYLPLAVIAHLQKTCRVTLALCWESDLNRASKTYGIEIDDENLRVKVVRPRGRLLRYLDSIIPFYRSWQLKKLASAADLCISTIGIMDFGKPAHSFMSSMRDMGDNALLDFVFHRVRSPVGKLKQRTRTFLAEKLLRPILGIRSTRRIFADKREQIYPNSRFVAQTLRSFYGDFSGRVLYPVCTFAPKEGRIARDPMKVVFIGRIDARKRLDDIIDIVAKARALSGRPLTLCFAGFVEPTAYAERVKARIDSIEWCKLAGPVAGTEKEDFLQSGTYAIHANRDEDFGISVTEYIKAGCIPIVPDEGGAHEILDTPELSFVNVADAAEKLSRLVTSDQFRNSARLKCARRSSMFSKESTLQALHSLLDEITNA